MGILEKLFGKTSDKEIRRIEPIVNKVMGLESTMEALSDEALAHKTVEFRERLGKGETLDDLLPEAFAVVREAAWRTLQMKPFRVQVIGGIILHQGRIAEMRTGEGKTLVATLPVYLNALEGKGVHVVTVNDYLANRDAEWMGQVYRFLGLTVGCILNGLSNDERRAAYACDITYGTNNEFGFDYLRDNMVVYQKQLVQRDLHYALIDECDSVLIDEARTPLIISGSSGKSTSLYQQADLLASQLKKGRVIGDTSKMAELMNEEIIEEGDFIVDEKAKSCTLTQQGVARAEQFFHIPNLSDPENAEIVHHINIALKANYLMFKDRDYVVKDGQIIIVDEFTGRMMPGRRYSDGLHQAIEAKEKVEVKRESKTLATITFQNFFNKYKKKAGMTGTAKTEEIEFEEIYGMDVVEIPTNKPVVRKDMPDVVFRTQKEKFRAVVRDIIETHSTGQPVLVGTISIETSELVSKMLKREGIAHNVLNAKFHEREAQIVAEAGQAGAVTIATNMAGRGTDIKLGEGVAALGGLKIIGTERHEARRIDNQLRGRAGRQGDPGASRFYVSMEDDLMRIFGGERMQKVLETFRIPEDQPIEDKMFSGAIERAQKRVEENNFGIRRRLLEYDQVMNEQRETIYAERRRVLMGENLKDDLLRQMDGVIAAEVNNVTAGTKYPEEWNMADLNTEIRRVIPFPKEISVADELETITPEKLTERLQEEARELYEAKEQEIEPERMREVERMILLRSVDTLWTDHLDVMDQMRQGISLQAFAQKNPLDEYRLLGFDMFEELNENIIRTTIHGLFTVHLVEKEEVERKEVGKNISTNRGGEGTQVKKPVKRADKKIGRNDPCPCGSGKKYKNCHGRFEQ
ncbi:MAG: preprotein translocase subunit SecA [Firmicutes bacterium]|nr:preprotein translocase subunit SecA [Bacillota bacterium]